MSGGAALAEPTMFGAATTVANPAADLMKVRREGGAVTNFDLVIVTTLQVAVLAFSNSQSY
jgi:hypothetical protein